MLLTLYGSIDLTQYWPQNILTHNKSDSDGDTVKVLIDPAKGFVVDDGHGHKARTNVFDAAIVRARGQKDKKVVHNGMVTIRWQGIDDPELHYSLNFKPPVLRQHMGETSTVVLYNYMKTFTASNTLECEVTTKVNEPNEVFDMYGRFIGDIIITGHDGTKINLNHWQLEQGLTFPAFYVSLTEEEIKALTQLAQTGKTKPNSVWKYYSKQVKKIDRTLAHDKKDGTYDEKADRKKPVIFPKLFRRLYSYEIAGKAKFNPKSFHNFLAMKKPKDYWYLASEFLQYGQSSTTKRTIDEAVGPDGKLKFDPEDIIFEEGGSLLLGQNGQKVSGF